MSDFTACLMSIPGLNRPQSENSYCKKNPSEALFPTRPHSFHINFVVYIFQAVDSQSVYLSFTVSLQLLNYHTILLHPSALSPFPTASLISPPFSLVSPLPFPFPLVFISPRPIRSAQYEVQYGPPATGSGAERLQQSFSTS